MGSSKSSRWGGFDLVFPGTHNQGWMLFNSGPFLAFFLVFFLVFKFVARTRIEKLWTIAFGSFFFYGAWDFRFLPLLLGTALIDFYVARAIQHNPGPASRKRLLTLSIACNLGVLVFFKYTGFFLRSAFGLLDVLGVHVSSSIPEIVLPIGISFYTFQSMSYTIDVYRGELRAREKPLEFLAAVSFFPHLVAGPIIRASTLLPQFERFRPLPWSAIQRGFLLIAVGLFKKNLADLLSTVVGPVFSGEQASGTLSCWTGALAFAGQIFCDFSGYTDIAIGIALLLGFRLPENFRLPYLALTPQDFWRRWHISLSTWLRDYLYIPLGGNRGNRGNRYRNLMITMGLGGLWHGANWTFVVWGLCHGGLLVLSSIFSKPIQALGRHVAGRMLLRLGTFYAVLVLWVVFRADTVGRALGILREMHWPVMSSMWNSRGIVQLAAVVFALVLSHGVSWLLTLPEGKEETEYRPWILWPAVATVGALALIFAGPDNAFIYFQF
jgi:D-alanyl-lipoteichoic acid acyltransferase DltB (MBOAT superfamily)